MLLLDNLTNMVGRVSNYGLDWRRTAEIFLSKDRFPPGKSWRGGLLNILHLHLQKKAAVNSNVARIRVVGGGTLELRNGPTSMPRCCYLMAVHFAIVGGLFKLLLSNKLRIANPEDQSVLYLVTALGDSALVELLSARDDKPATSAHEYCQNWGFTCFPWHVISGLLVISVFDFM